MKASRDASCRDLKRKKLIFSRTLEGQNRRTFLYESCRYIVYFVFDLMDFVFDYDYFISYCSWRTMVVGVCKRLHVIGASCGCVVQNVVRWWFIFTLLCILYNVWLVRYSDCGLL